MDLQKRKPLRLNGYDYSQNGAYFITVCTKNKQNILGKIVGDGLCAVPKTCLSEIGFHVEKSILHMNSYHDINIDKYIVMPNHVHILVSVYNEEKGKADIDISDVIKRFKSYTTNLYGAELWQRSFHDHIIRCQADYDETWQYIDENPLKWFLEKDERM